MKVFRCQASMSGRVQFSSLNASMFSSVNCAGIVMFKSKHKSSTVQQFLWSYFWYSVKGSSLRRRPCSGASSSDLTWKREGGVGVKSRFHTFNKPNISSSSSKKTILCLYVLFKDLIQYQQTHSKLFGDLCYLREVGEGRPQVLQVPLSLLAQQGD